MNSWPEESSLNEVALELIGDLKPDEILYEFEGPCIFTATIPTGSLVLAYLSEEIEEHEILRYILSTTSNRTIHEMVSGIISVREALERGSLMVVDFDYTMTPIKAFNMPLGLLPEDALPSKETMLWPELEPAFAVRLEWEEAEDRNIPAAALSLVAGIANKAFKPVFEWAARELREDTSGRPPEWIRDIYRFPSQRLAFGSLEVAFAKKTPEKIAQRELPFEESDHEIREDIYKTGWDALLEGFSWATSGSELNLDEIGDGKKWVAILETMKQIAPPTRGAVNQIRVWGLALGSASESFMMTRDTSKSIRTALARLKAGTEVELRVFKGKIRDLDLDKHTMILRDMPDTSGDVSFLLEDEELLEDAKEAHYLEIEVSVAARRENEKSWTATDIELTRADNPPAQ